jgi:hypothetical protein
MTAAADHQGADQCVPESDSDLCIRHRYCRDEAGGGSPRSGERGATRRRARPRASLRLRRSDESDADSAAPRGADARGLVAPSTRSSVMASASTPSAIASVPHVALTNQAGDCRVGDHIEVVADQHHGWQSVEKHPAPIGRRMVPCVAARWLTFGIASRKRHRLSRRWSPSQTLPSAQLKMRVAGSHRIWPGVGVRASMTAAAVGRYRRQWPVRQRKVGSAINRASMSEARPPTVGPQAPPGVAGNAVALETSSLCRRVGRVFAVAPVPEGWECHRWDATAGLHGVAHHQAQGGLQLLIGDGRAAPIRQSQRPLNTSSAPGPGPTSVPRRWRLGRDTGVVDWGEAGGSGI